MPDTHPQLNPKDWVENFSDLLFRFALLRVNDRELAKDLVQDAFLAALKNVNSWRGEISEKNWLVMILKNKIIDHYRRKGSKEGLIEPAKNEKNFDFFDDAGHWTEKASPTSWDSAPEQNYEQGEFNTILQKCVSKLSEVMRMVFCMKYLEEEESEIICKELMISPSNYWVLMHRSKVQLRACIEKNWFVK